MSDLGAGDALLGWVRRNLLAMLAIASAAGFAQSELANLREGLGDLRERLQVLHRDFIAFQVSGAGVAKERFLETVAELRAHDRRQQDAFGDQSARLAALEAALALRGDDIMARSRAEARR